MMIKNIRLLLLLLACAPSLDAFPFFTNYSKQTPQETIEQLQSKQVNKPNDPHVNYNLGVALYKAGRYSDAKENFKRAVKFGKSSTLLQKRCYFNLGNSLYQKALKAVGPNWESTKINEKVLHEAIQDVADAVKEFGNVLELDADDLEAQENKDAAEDLLKRLQEKEAKQQQEKQQEKQQKEQDKKEKQDKKDDAGQDKDKQQGQDNKEGQKSGQDKDKQQGDQKQEQKKDQAQDNKKEQQSGQDKQQQEQEKQEQKKQEGQGQHKSEEQKRKEAAKKAKEQAEQKNSKQQEEKKQQAAAGDKEEGADNDKKEMGGAAAAQQGEEDDSLEKRQARAVLDNLEQHEADLQKHLINRNIHGRQQRQITSQRPW